MSARKTDGRVRYTKAMLKNSFIDLLEQKDISHISIKEVCEGADINRATFYAHYTDLYDLMRQIQDELLQNIQQHLAAYTQNDESDVTRSMLERIFDYIRENAKICKLLLGERGDLHFQKRIFLLAYERNIKDLTLRHKIPDQEAEYIYAFILTGSIGIVQKWLNDPMEANQRFVIETINRLTAGLSMAGAWEA